MRWPLARVATLGCLLAVLVSCGAALPRAAVPQADREVDAEPAGVEARVAAVSASAPRVTGGTAVSAMTGPATEVKAALPALDNITMSHVWQSLNNCGPAAVVMALSTMNISESQEVARLALRGPDQNRGMGPAPVDPWVKERFGVRSMYRTSGTNDLLKRLLSNGFTPMVTQWLQDPWVSRISHWRTVRGYDDARAVFYVNDSMLGRGVPLSYDWFATNWQPFSYRYMVLYRPEDEPRLRAIVGDDWSDSRNRHNFYERARTEASAHDTSAAWLTLGEAAYQYGQFAEAVGAFEKGIMLGSPSGVFTMRSSYPNALRALGRHAEADAAAGRLVNLTPSVVAAAAPTIDERILDLVAQRQYEAWSASIAEEQKPLR